MTRVKGAKHAIKRRRKLLKKAKGYRFGRSTKKRQAKEAVIHAGVHSFNHRKDKKGDFRRLWQVKINAAARSLGITYSNLISAMKKNKMKIDRKILADLAEHNPETFSRIVEKIK